MFCRNCGHEIPDDSKFCESCGAVLQNDARQVSPKYDGGNYTKNEASDKSSGINGGLSLIVSIVIVSVFLVGILSLLELVDFSVRSIILVIFGTSVGVIVTKTLRKFVKK